MDHHVRLLLPLRHVTLCATLLCATFVIVDAQAAASGSAACEHTLATCLSSSAGCTILPLPNGPNVVLPPDQFTLTRVRRSVFSFFDGFYYSLIVHKNARLMVIDAPVGATSSWPNGTYKLNAAIDLVLRTGSGTAGAAVVVRRADLVYGHSHHDHIGGMALVRNHLRRAVVRPRGAINVYGARWTTQVLARDRDNTLPPINMVVSPPGRAVVMAPALEVRLYTRSGHDREDVAALIRASRDGPGILHLTDYVIPGYAPFLGFGLSDDLTATLDTLAWMATRNFRVLSAGHAALGSLKDVAATAQYIRDALQFSREAVAETTQDELMAHGLYKFFTPGEVEFGNEAFAFMTQLKVYADKCKRKVLQKHGCLLNGVAQFADDHCRTAHLFQVKETAK